MKQPAFKMKSGRVIFPIKRLCTSVHDFCVHAGNELVARAWVTEEPMEDTEGKAGVLIILHDIVVYDERNRRKGIADELMALLCDCYPVILTGISTKAGRKLCYKHGFTLRRGDKNRPYLMYIKEDAHATDE